MITRSNVHFQRTVTLYKVSDEKNGTVHIAEIAKKPLMQEMLKTEVSETCNCTECFRDTCPDYLRFKRTKQLVNIHWRC